MIQSSKAHTLTWLAAAVFVAQALFSFVHLVRGAHYPEFNYWPHDPILDSVNTLAWLGGAVAMLLRKRWCIYLASAGIVTSFAHSLHYSLSQPYVGIPFFVAAALELIVLARCWQLFRGDGQVREEREPRFIEQHTK